MNNETNLNSQVSDVLVDRRSFGGNLRSIPLITGATALAASSEWTLSSVTGNASLSSAFEINNGRVGQSFVMAATNPTTLSWSGNAQAVAFATVGDELVYEYELAFDATFAPLTGFFLGLTSSTAPVFNDTIASGTLPDALGFHKATTATSVSFVTRTGTGTASAIAIPGLVFASSTRYLLRFSIRKTADSATSAVYRVQVIENALSNGGTVSGTGKTYVLEGTTSVLPATTTPLYQAGAFAKASAGLNKLWVFGDALRFVTKA